MEQLFSTLLPALAIAALRIGDVVMNVFRTVFTVQGRKSAASVAAGAEAAIWLSAAGIVFANLTPVRAAGYVAGVVAGTWIGAWIIERLRLGRVTVRIYADASDDLSVGMRMAKEIHAAGYAATTFEGHGYKGPVAMVLSTVRRRDADRVVDCARQVVPDAFASVDADPFRRSHSVRAA